MSTWREVRNFASKKFHLTPATTKAAKVLQHRYVFMALLLSASIFLSFPVTALSLNKGSFTLLFFKRDVDFHFSVRLISLDTGALFNPFCLLLRQHRLSYEQPRFCEKNFNGLTKQMKIVSRQIKILISLEFLNLFNVVKF